jgi:hypothetical protein
MSHCECQAVQAAAHELEAWLTTYELHVHELVFTWLDMDLYRTVSDEIDVIRGLCAGLPELSVPWVGLLVSHAELVHCLWRRGQPGQRPDSGELQQRLQEHPQCIAGLAERSRRLGDAR